MERNPPEPEDPPRKLDLRISSESEGETGRAKKKLKGRRSERPGSGEPRVLQQLEEAAAGGRSRGHSCQPDKSGGTDIHAGGIGEDKPGWRRAEGSLCQGQVMSSE